jgi:hypothetical protein
VAAAIVDMDSKVIVLQLLDNSCYYGRMRDGSRTAPKRGEEGKYQFEGEVTVCSHDTQLEHLKAISGILDLVRKRKCLLVTALPRYVTAGCCLDLEHCSSRRFHRQHLLSSLEVLCKNFKDFLYFDGRRNVKFLRQCIVIGSMSDAEVWVEDPIHSTEAVYSKIEAPITKISSNLAKHNRADSTEGRSPTGPDTRNGQRESRSQTDWDRYRSDNRRTHQSRGGLRGGRNSRGQGSKQPLQLEALALTANQYSSTLDLVRGCLLAPPLGMNIVCCG